MLLLAITYSLYSKYNKSLRKSADLSLLHAALSQEFTKLILNPIFSVSPVQASESLMAQTFQEPLLKEYTLK